MMVSSNHSVVTALFGLVSCFIFLTNAETNCDPTTCTGPLYYYQELGCLPIYDNSSSCCARKYNCDHWKVLPDSKCYVNGRVYESGMVFPPREIGGGCDRCICAGGTKRARCLASSCAGPKPGCYFRGGPLDCCSKFEICQEDVPTCEVDGKTYKNGEDFVPQAEPKKICTCGPGYSGTNDEHVCVTIGPGWCGNAVWSVEKIQRYCAPVFPFGKDPQTNCNVDYRCHMGSKDSVVDTERVSESEDPDMMCKFGNLTLKVGQMLNQPEDENRPMQCVCDVPPVVTCRYLADVVL